MNRDELQSLVDRGILPWQSLYDETFNWDLDPSLFTGTGVNWEDPNAVFYPRGNADGSDGVQMSEVQGPQSSVPVEPSADGGGGYSISLDVLAPSVIAATLPAILPAKTEESPMDSSLASLFSNTALANQGNVLNRAIEALGNVLGMPPNVGGMPATSIEGLERATRPITVNAYARQCPPGYHVVKSGRNKGNCGKVRRMNPLNPDALRRSVRRLSGFQHFATKTEKLIQHSFRKAGVAPSRRRIGGSCGTCRKTPCGCR